MSTKEMVYELFTSKGIAYRPNDSFEKLSNRIDQNSELTLDDIRNLYRFKWKGCPKSFHLNNLRNGKLRGHDWHGTMPSMLHLGMQNKVRDCIEGKIALDELIEIGADIMKHEYFMVAAHDLLESHIIENITEAIPPIGSKSITDFIFKGVPYDLKNTNYFGGHTKLTINHDKASVARQLVNGADVERLREQAKKTHNNWGLNRFFVLIQDQERWSTDPEGILDEILEETNGLGDPMRIEIGGIIILVQLIAI